MASERLRGIAEANATFDRLPADARDQLAVELAIIGREIRADQERLTPSDTGNLRGQLDLQVFLDSLKLRVGLIALGRGARRRGDRRRAGRDGYYGRFVALGRTAQTVNVTRRVGKAFRRVRGNNRNGNARRTEFVAAGRGLRRRGPNKGTPIGGPYKMRVQAMAARDFIRVPGAEAEAMGQLAEFWSRLLARRGGGA